MFTVKSIIFDLDNTLLWDERSIDEAFKETCRLAEVLTGVNPVILEQTVRETAETLFKQMEIYEWAHMIEVTYLEALWGNFTTGETSALRMLKELAPVYQKESWYRSLLHTGIDQPELGLLLAEKFAFERRQRPLLYDDTLDVLNQLKSDYSLLLMTNGAPDLQQEKIDSIPGLADYFDHIIISGTFGVGKPAPSIFEHAMKLLDVSPQEVLMIGDNLHTDIKGACGVGMPNVWINHHQAEVDTDHKPTYEISSLSGLIAILQDLKNKIDLTAS